MRIFGFSGSLRTGSYNTQLFKLAASQLAARGVEVDAWDFRAANVPIYDPDTSDTNYPPQLADAKARIKAAQGLLVVTPEYNRGLPGSVKNLFDFLSRPPRESPFKGKVITNMGATPGGFATISARVQFRQLSDALGMLSVPGEYVVSSAATAFDEQGQLKDEKRRAELSSYLDRFVGLVQQVSK